MKNVVTSSVSAGAAMDQWGQHQLGPAIGKVAMMLDTYGKEQLGPAMGEVAKAFDEFGREKIRPAMMPSRVLERG